MLFARILELDLPLFLMHESLIYPTESQILS